MYEYTRRPVSSLEEAAVKLATAEKRFEAFEAARPQRGGLPVCLLPIDPRHQQHNGISSARLDALATTSSARGRGRPGGPRRPLTRAHCANL